MGFKAEDLHAGYVADIDILRGLTLEARSGQITTVIGANGVGKSTLLKCAVGQLRPHQGRIAFGDQDLTKLATHELLRCGIAYIAQGRNVFAQMTVLENLEMGLWSIRMERRRCRDRRRARFSRPPLSWPNFAAERLAR